MKISTTAGVASLCAPIRLFLGCALAVLGFSAQAATIGDRAWLDTNANGLQDGGEPGFTNLFIDVFDAATSNFIAGTVTDANGNYSLDVATGSYFLKVGTPGFGYRLGPQDVGGNDTIDSDFNPSNALSDVFSVTANQTNLTLDASIIRLQPGYSFVKVAVGAPDGTPLDITPGTPVDYQYTIINTGNTELSEIFLADNQFGLLYALLPPAVLLPGQSVVITSNLTMFGSFTNIADICATPYEKNAPLGFDPICTSDDAVVLTEAPSSIGDYVWFDANEDGIQQTNETGFAGITVNLYDGATNLVTNTVTDANGFYEFTNLVSGTYVLGYILPLLYEYAPQNQGADDNLDSDPSFDTGLTDPIALPPGTTLTNVDAALITIRPYLSLTKLAGTATNGGSYLATNSEPVLYTYIITNTGNSYLSDVMLFDDRIGMIAQILAPNVIPPGGVVTITTNAIVTESVTNNAFICGTSTDFRGIPYSLVDPACTNDDAVALVLGSIAGSVLVDFDGDGAFDPEDTNGLAGVTITLLDASSNVYATALTGPGGAYLFTNLPPGDYTVQETDPAGYTSTGDTVPPNDNLVPVALTPGLNSTGNDFLDTLPGAILGAVLVDVDGDGTFDPVDTNGIPSVTVALMDATSNVVATTTTGAGGGYAFTNVPPGVYTVVETDPAGYFSTGDTAPPNDNRITVVITTGETSSGNDFLDTQPGTISGSVLVDADGDGTFDPVDTNGIPSVQVTLLDSSSNVVATTTTGPNGGYSFTNVPPGDYTVVETDPAGYFSTGDTSAPNDNRIPVTILTGQSSTGNDFLDTQPGTITGSVLDDVDGDGTFDPEDLTNGIPAVTVTLLNASSNVVATTTTGPTGGYSFTNVPPGAYAVVETDPAGYFSTADIVPPNDNSIPLVLLTGESRTGNDFLDTLPGTIGDFVWNDLNGDGIQDPGEPGLNGVTVTLYDAATNPIATTLTVAGIYNFTNLPPATYLLGVAAPSGFIGSPMDAGTNDLLDSDFSPAAFQTLPFQLTSGESDQSLDAGLFNSGTIGDFVWFDANEDGIQQTNEAGFVGVRVDLYDGNTNFIRSETSDSSGHYTFSNVVAGTYILGFVPPLLYQYGLQDRGGNDNLDSDPNFNNGFTAPITLLPGAAITNVDGALIVVRPQLDLTKLAGNAPDGTAYQATNGEAVLYTYIVTNSGNSYLSSLQLFDDRIGMIAQIDPPTVIPPGGVLVVTTNAVINDSVTNIAQVCAVSTDYRAIPYSLVDPACTNDDAVALVLGTVSGSVFVDVDGDGTFDAQDTNGIPAVTVALLNASSNVFATTTTAPDGSYLFTNVPAGSFTVRETDPSGYQSTADIVPPNDNLIPVTLIPGQHVAGNNFLDTQPGTISGSVLVDVDGDGSFDPEDTNGIASVTVTLRDSASNSVATTSTGPTGAYIFTNVPPGSYTVVETDPAGYNSTGDTAPPNDNRIPVTITTGGSSSGNNFLDTQPGAISGSVLVDVNGDGLFDPPDTNGIAGVTVTLYDASSNVVQSVLTGPTGGYAFTNLPPGAYTVVETDPAGYTSTGDRVPPNDNRIPVVITTGQSSIGNDFLDTQPTLIGNFVWDDLDANGVQDPGETGVVGVAVSLYGASSNLIATVITDGGGFYAFTNVPPATYFLGIAPPAGYLVGPQDVGTNDLIDSDFGPATLRTAPFVMTSGETDLSLDASIYRTTTLGDFVWNDLDGDGIQDALEPGLSNITVRLLDGLSNVILATTTDGTGLYAFTNVVPGAYFVQFVPPAGQTFSPQYATTNAVLDSDATTNGISGLIVLISGEVNTNVDAGLTAPASLGDFVWADNDKDGLQDAGEPGVAGATVNLYDATGTNLVGTQVTPGSGAYLFTGLAVGSYIVEVIPPAEHLYTTANIGGDDTVDSDLSVITGRSTALFLQSGETNRTLDAGFTLASAIGIEKGPDNQTIYSGSTATFVITVTNNGGSTLFNVNVTDPAGLACERLVGTMAPGAAVTYTCTVAGVNASFTNTAFASGFDFYTNAVGATNSAAVRTIVPSIGIAKSPDLQYVTNGQSAVFTITVTNSGSSTLTNVVVNDPMSPNCDNASIGTLAPGQSFSYLCSVVITDDLFNVAYVTGRDELGGTVTNSDSAQVLWVTTNRHNCTRSANYWGCHPNVWPTNALVLGGVQYDQAGLVSLFVCNPTDVTYRVAKELVAAQFNLMVGADRSFIRGVMQTADVWLVSNPVGSNPIGAQAALGTNYADTLMQYNVGILGPGSCYPNAPVDLDGDLYSDIAVYWPAQGTWFALRSTRGPLTENFGWSEAIPVPADYDGDAQADIAVYHPAAGNWYVHKSTTMEIRSLNWGWSDALPVPADYDGDGYDDFAVYYPATGGWYLRESSGDKNAPKLVNWGWSQAVPVPADYDGDRKTDVAVYNPQSGTWYIQKSSTGTVVEAWGFTQALPVPGDYDGDQRADLGVYHPASGLWSIKLSGGGTLTRNWGFTGAVPVPGDYDADGKTDIAVLHIATGRWYIQLSDGGTQTVDWGFNQTIPVLPQWQINRWMGAAMGIWP